MNDYSILSKTQRGGAKKLLIGSAVFMLFVAISIFGLPLLGIELDPFGLAKLALPGAYALIGLIELVTDTSFTQFDQRWSQLKGWQRGIIGTIIVLVALIVIICGLGFIASRLPDKF